MFPYDQEIRRAVQAVPQSIAEVLGTLQRLDGILAEGDGLKWFNWLYVQVTTALRDGIDSGRFSDPAWLAELDVRFGRLYFQAVDTFLGGGKAAGCWRALLDRRAEAALARAQFAVAGVNAHINHDLPLAIVETCERFGAAPLHGSTHYADYTAINGTLATLVEEAKEKLFVGLLGDALPPVSHLEDTLAAWSMTAAREAAWTNGELAWRIRDFGPLAARFEHMLDGMTTVAGKALLTPVR